MRTGGGKLPDGIQMFNVTSDKRDKHLKAKYLLDIVVATTV